MTILAVNQVKQNTTPNIAFEAKDKKSEKHNKSTKIATNIAIATGIGALGVVGYKKNWAEKTFKWLSETKFMKNKVFPNYEKDNAKFMSAIGVTSIVLKDGLGCYLYVKQSLNNEKIPEDKRKFVAALDLANGGLMIAMQLLMFFTISNKKVQEKIFNKLFGKYFTRSADKALQAKLGKIDKLKDMTGKEFHTAREADKKGLKNAFSYLISLAAATLIAKRIIVPFIATPLADKTKAWMSRNDKPVATHKDTKNTYNTEKPAATIENKEKNEDKNTQFAGNNTQNKTTNLLNEVKNQK